MLLHLQFPQNQNIYQSYELNIEQSKIKTVGQLRQAIASRFYLQPTCIYLKYQLRMLEDNKVALNSLPLDKNRNFTVAIIEQEQKPIHNAKPIKIGGLDLTNVKQIQAIFNKEKPAQKPAEKRVPPAPTKPSPAKIQKKEQKEIDFKKKYQKELIQLKNQLQLMGFQKNEEEILVLLISTNGRVDRALDTLLESSLS